MKKLIFLFLIIFSIITFGQKPLVVGMELAYPPFETTDKYGNPSGFSVDMATDLGKYLGREVVIENMSYGGLIPALRTEKIDIILSSMSITDRRKRSINFSTPYAKSNLAILANQNSGIKDPMDLNKKGKKVAVKKGTTGHVVALKSFPNADILVFEKESACILEVTQGKVDAFIYDPLTILKNWKKNKNTTEAILKPFEETPQYWAIAYSKNNNKLGEQINNFIKNYKKNGSLDRLADKYLAEPKEEFEKRNIPFFL
ncbi:MAG: transporter substrate-binding domain-containing protein [Psychrilyobacter sp.]|uniref:transporter substrate-binding domain-containing protein n=1 Tax=Psychrilyobacter sp. TaxID=2586924 RepID=UPI003C74E625